MSYIGLDVGLSGCKACLFAEDDGRLLAGSYCEYQTESPQEGWRELNPALVWRSVQQVLAGLAESAAGDPPKALAVSSHGESAVPVSAKGEDLANAITPLDQRISDPLASRPGTGLAELWGDGLSMEEVVRITGQPPHPSYTLPRILWLRRHKPEIVKRAWKFLCFQEYILYRLGAKKPATSFSQAARTWAFDVHQKVWSDKILSTCGLRADLFADAVPAATVVGEMDPKTAKELKLPGGIKLLTGGHDQACGALGTGVIRSGLAVDSTGTVECITPSFAKPLPPGTVLKYNFCNSPHVVDGLYVTFAWNITGGSLLKWYRDRLGGVEAKMLSDNGLDFYTENLRELPGGPTGLLVLPHFAGSGTPWFWQDSYGLILGLDFETDKKRLLKAFLEGITFEMKYNIELLQQEGLRIETFFCIGGGAKSQEWLQIKADIFGLPVVRTEVTEGACLGCAMMCAHALQRVSYDQITQGWRAKSTMYEPRTAEARRYAEYFDLYRRMQETVRPLQQDLHQLRRRL